MTICMNMSRFMNLAAIFSLDLESQYKFFCLVAVVAEPGNHIFHYQMQMHLFAPTLSVSNTGVHLNLLPLGFACYARSSLRSLVHSSLHPLHFAELVSF